MSAAALTDDVFERFDRAMGQGRVRTPYPRYAEMRRAGPIVRIDLTTLIELMQQGADGPRREVPSELAVYAALSHEAVARVLRDAEAFSSGAYAASMGLVMGRTILQMDPPEHGRYRGLIQQAFSRRALERWEHELVVPAVHDRIDAFAGRGRADLVRELTFPFPVDVIAGMLGFPGEDIALFHRWAVEIISIGIDPERARAASREVAEYMAPILEERRRQPGPDLISVLAHAELDGVRLTDDEILGFMRLLMPAGAETTYRSSSNLLFALLTHAEQLEDLRRDRGLMERAIEEGLRWEPPLTAIVRLCTKDTEVCGVPVPAGAVVLVVLGSANHDEARHESPDAFDLHRESRPHMAFAFGAHRCLGMHLARMETRVAIDAVLDRLPGVRLDPAAEDVHITGA
ncbi:MAG: cytochrome P450, partial [Proteobacteria bacterium]|nr:cytochrome P450 [Pseudomonadota bacterium]